MIKPIFANRIGRNFIASTILATAALSTATTSPATAKNTAQKEIVSQAASTAMQSNIINLGTFSMAHNKKLDKIYLDKCDTENSAKSKKSTLNAIYNVYGTYGATIEIQREIDDACIKESLNKYLTHFSYIGKERKAATKITSDFYEWKNDVFYTQLFQEELKMYEEQEYPSAEKAMEVIDNHINNSAFFSKEAKETYTKGCQYFQAKQTNKNPEIAKSDLLAYKVHLLNTLAFHKFFTEDNKIPEKHVFMYYLDYEFLNGYAKIKP